MKIRYSNNFIMDYLNNFILEYVKTIKFYISKSNKHKLSYLQKFIYLKELDNLSNLLNVLFI